MKKLLTLNYDSSQSQLLDGRVTVNYTNILEQFTENENLTEVNCGTNPDTTVIITIADTETVLNEWKDLSLENKALIVDEAIYLDADGMVDNGTIDYGEIQTAIIFGA